MSNIPSEDKPDCICNLNGKYIYDPKCPQHPDESRLGILERENANLKTVMIAAAEEIVRHWRAHCDNDGYGPSNLMHRLNNGIPAQYGYTPGAFEKLDKENAELRLKLKEKEQEIEELTELRRNGAYNCSLLMVQLGEEKVNTSKLEQSNRELLEALKDAVKTCDYAMTFDQEERYQKLIQSEGTTKKE